MLSRRKFSSSFILIENLNVTLTIPFLVNVSCKGHCGREHSKEMLKNEELNIIGAYLGEKFTCCQFVVVAIVGEIKIGKQKNWKRWKKPRRMMHFIYQIEWRLSVSVSMRWRIFQCPFFFLSWFSIDFLYEIVHSIAFMHTLAIKMNARTYCKLACKSVEIYDVNLIQPLPITVRWAAATLQLQAQLSVFSQVAT